MTKDIKVSKVVEINKMLLLFFLGGGGGGVMYNKTVTHTKYYIVV